MKTNTTNSNSTAKRNPAPKACAAVLKTLASSAVTSFGFGSNTGSVTKVPIDGASISSRHVCNRFIEQAAATDPLRTPEENDLRFVEVLEMMRELQPRSTLEGMLCTQMIGMHNLIMESLRRGISEGGSAETTRAVRLAKVFLEQIATRERLRGRFAQQHVTVEHIHVESGARAVVGVAQVEESKDGQESER